MAKKNNIVSNESIKKDLGYLGSDFQKKLVKVFIEDSNFFTSMNAIVDQNMFTDDILRRIVGLMKDRYNESGLPPTYVDLGLYIRTHVQDVITLDTILSTLDLLRGLDLLGQDIVKEEADKFFKQQNIIKAINKSIEIVKIGNSSRYYDIEDMFRKALERNVGVDSGYNPMDGIDEALEENYRKTIPTGFNQLDRMLYGGLGKGELGLIIAPAGVGKAQPLTSRILTPNGYMLMGDIHIGDEIIGCDGRAHNVIGVYPQGMRPVYKVTFSNGQTCECDEEHLWNVSLYNQKKNTPYQTMSLKDIIKRGIRKNGRYIFRIPRCKAVEFTKKEVDINSFLVGYFNGEDTLLPSLYLYNDIETRLMLLRGLMTERGTVNKKGECLFKTKNKSLAEQVRWLFESLEGWAIITEKDEVFTVRCIVTNNEYNPFLTEAKAEKVVVNEGYKHKLYITNIEYLRDDETQCIMIDSDEHLYLTENFIVTHNTSVTTGFAASAATYKCKENNGKGFKVLHIHFEDEDVNIKRKYYGWLTGIDAVDLSKPEVKELVKAKLKNELSEETQMIRNNIWCFHLPSGEVSAGRIEQIVKQGIARGFTPDMIIIDYFECLEADKGDKTDSEWTKEGYTMRKLEALAHKYDIAIWCPIQGTKNSFDKEILGLDSAGGSVKKVQIGHVIITLSRTMEQRKNHRVTVSLEKFRAGRMDNTSLPNVRFNNGTCRFEYDEEDDSVLDYIAEQEKIYRNNGINNSMKKRIQ